MLGRLFASPEGDPCRRVIQVRHSERLSGIPRVLALIATLGRAAEFPVALPHVAGSSLVEATRAPSDDGAKEAPPVAAPPVQPCSMELIYTHQWW